MSDTPTTPADPTGINTAITNGIAAASQEPAETFSREYVTGLRQEAAKYRNEKNTAVEEAKAARDAEWQAKLDTQLGESNRLSTNLGDAWIELAKVYAALDQQVPSDKVRAFAQVVQGSDPESIAESAKSAKELFGGFKSNSPATDPTQGSGGGTPALNSDALLQAVKSAVGA